MTFNKCSIAGRPYGDVIDLTTGDIIEVTEVSLISLVIFMVETKHKNIPKST
jgi:hypothetical protein